MKVNTTYLLINFVICSYFINKVNFTIMYSIIKFVIVISKPIPIFIIKLSIFLL